MTSKAFWLWPDWSGGYNLRDPGTQPFWMLDPCPEAYEVEQVPSRRCEGCHKALSEGQLRIKHAAPYSKNWWVAVLCRDCYRPTLPPGTPKGLLCRIGLHKFWSYSGEPHLFSCHYCGEQKDESFIDPTGVKCWIGQYDEECICGSPFPCVDESTCMRSSNFVSITGISRQDSTE